MNIFLTNDDGIYATGLWALHQRFVKNHSVTVIAPDRERSAVGHGITLYKPLRLTKVTVNGGYTGYSVNGTPADCVKLGILEILDSKPDIVISGINPGANVGININYSGTVAAAKEAALYGIPAIAVSIHGKEIENYNDATCFIKMLAENVYENKLPFGTILNVNIPDMPKEKIAGVKISRQSVIPLDEYIEKRIDPRNRTYYWQACNSQTSFEKSEIDGAALGQNYISITPIKCDTTDYATLETLKKWDINKL
ncbi:MAG: 5'/3'-nucleotidase SurE [Deltaproteobacteria bacterium]|nr:5'/3'-nucleotidase SurE [Deltaproteobacteria bacterium]MBW2660689.1 5'/3'-nucleotidase SurE [Deltaproteobacteria bacterium]